MGLAYSPRYNLKSYFKNNKLKIFFTTTQNSLNIISSEISLLNPISDVCINSLCYCTPDKIKNDIKFFNML
jgi:hypothetical protein